MDKLVLLVSDWHPNTFLNIDKDPHSYLYAPKNLWRKLLSLICIQIPKKEPVPVVSRGLHQIAVGYWRVVPNKIYSDHIEFLFDPADWALASAHYDSVKARGIRYFITEELWNRRRSEIIQESV